jgi:DNA topoisomerase-3
MADLESGTIAVLAEKPSVARDIARELGATSRLWISSLTPEAIRNGFSTLRPGADFDSLADAARGRSQADWLVGMNLSRAYALGYDEKFSVGRVQPM